jgi:tRNA-dihydrouridine synthase A
MQPSVRRFSIAPMLDCTDRHARYFLRLFSRRMLLYTEMITTGAILNGDRDYLLGFDASEHPLAVQLGGSQPEDLAACARICEQYGYDEVNLNVGCPSDRVKSGFFGACLMAQPALVADCVRAMKDATNLPVTVKHRTGIDEKDSWQELVDFVGAQVEAGADALIVHARKAWLQGLSPRQNREIPPLQYDTVYRLKGLFPLTPIVINGGITDLDQCQQHLRHVDGVMLGREPYANPWMLVDVDRRIYSDSSSSSTRSRAAVIERFLPYVQRQLDQGLPLSRLLRHVMGLYHGQPNGRLWRRYLSENGYQQGATCDVFREAAKLVCSDD